MCHMLKSQRIMALPIPLLCFVVLFGVLLQQCNAQLSSSGGKVSLTNPDVALSYCTVRGTEYPLSTGTPQRYKILAFTGVPYAVPPVGTDRFRPPKQITTTIDCPARRVMCRQFGRRFETKSQIQIEESEDCLHMNIYVPVDRPSATYPVLVYFHGGEFKYGGKDLFKPDYLYDSIMANGQEMIVVTVNYRLGVFGFLSTDDTNQPGNNGIRDQLLALQWINQNIGLFQGNPNQVTIMGHDAGGVSVGIHILNQEAAKYFRSAISISGTVFSPWAFEDVPVQQARDFGYRFGCPYQTDKLVDCLRYADANALVQTVLDSVDLNSNRQPFWFRAVVDKNVTTSALLTDFPLQLYQSGKNNRVPYLVAGTSSEGTLEFYLQSERVKGFQELDAKIAYLIRPYLKHYTNEDVISSAMSFKYFNRTHRSYSASGTGNLFSGSSNPYSQQSAIGQNNAYNTFGNLNPYVGSNTGNGLQYGTVQGYSELQANQIFSQMLGDFLYLAPMDYAAKLHSASGAEVIMMVFDYTGSKSFGTIQIGAPPVSRDNYGATHNNDLWYSWLNEYDLAPLTGNEFTLYRAYSSFLAQFVLLGTASQNYRRYTPQTPNYVTIRFPSTQAINVNAQYGRGYRTDYFDFLNDFMTQLIEKSKIFPPYFPVEEYKSYQTATWSLLGVVILVVVLVVIAGAILFLRKKESGPSEQVRLKRRRDESDPLNG